MTFTPTQVDVVAFPKKSTFFSVTAKSSKTIAQQVNVAIIDTKGVITANARVSGAGLQYVASMSTNPNLAPGTYTGNFEVRVCYDANPTVCAQPVEGSPWQLPYKIRVLDPSELSYSDWEPAQTTPGFLDNFALGYRDGKPVVVSAGFYTAVMETYISADIGTSWTKQSVTGPTPLTRGFALASDGDAIYLVGGQTLSSYAKLLGQYTSHVWKYDGSTWQLKTAAAPFPGREYHVAAKVGNALYVAGGRTASGTLRDLWVSNDDGVSWTQRVDALPAALGDVSCALNWQGSLLLVGDQVATSSDGVQWNVRGGLPATFPKKSTQCAMFNGKLVIAATVNNLYTMSTADLVNWQPEPTRLAGPFDAPGMAAIGGRLVVTTGQGTSQRTTYRTVP